MSVPGLTVLCNDPTFIVANWRNVSITMYLSVPTIEQLHYTGHKVLERQYPDGFAALVVMHASAMKVSPEVRAEAERVSKNVPVGLKAIAHVIVGRGFAAATMRAIASGVMALSRKTVASKIFDEPRPASNWLLTKLGEAPGPLQARSVEELVAAVDYVAPTALLAAG